MKIARALMMFLAICLMAWQTPASADELCNKSSAQLTAEIDGIGSPDARFVIASVDTLAKGMIDDIAKSSPVGNQNSNMQIAQSRSTGCSTGCSNGCSNGCSTGCSVGCSTGCR